MRSSLRVAVLLLAAGCATAPAPVLDAWGEPPGPIVLTVAAYPNFDEAVRAALPRWNALHPEVRVELRSLAFGDHHKAMLGALAAGTNVPDVVAVEIGFLGRFAETGALADLGAPPYDGAASAELALPFAAAMARHGGVLTAMPADTGPGTLLYRKDILEKAGVTEAELTRSWESFIRAGEQVRTATGAALLADATEIYRISIRAGLRDGEGTYFGPDREILVGRPRFRRAFELARMARQAGVDAKIEMWTEAWADGIRLGRIATLPTGSWMAWHLDEWLAPDLRGLWRAAHLPADGYAAWGGSFVAIPKAAKHRRTAWAFLRFLCLDREQQLAAYQQNATWPALRAAQDGPFVDAPVAYLGDQLAGRLWRDAAARVPAVVLDRLDPVAAHVVEAELKEVLERGKAIDVALADAERQLERRLRRQ